MNIKWRIQQIFALEKMRIAFESINYKTYVSFLAKVVLKFERVKLKSWMDFNSVALDTVE